MTIRVKFFALARDAAGSAERTMDVPDGANVEAALQQLAKESPALTSLLARCAVAVNLSMAARPTQLQPGDELAVLPPVSGG